MTDEVIDKPTFNKTRAELMQENAELRKQLAQVATATDGPDNDALQAELTELRALQATRAGWLITTDNLLYDGTTHGIKFEAGMAYVPVNAKFPKYRTPPVKEAYKEMHNLSEAEWAQMKKRAARSDAEIVVELISQDMRGYRAEYYDANQQRELQQRMETRRSEAQATLEKAKTGTHAALTMPGYAGA